MFSLSIRNFEEDQSCCTEKEVMTDRSKTLPGLAVENSVAGSKKAWIRDLFELYEHAEGLYPDMRWRVQKERFAVWGHKGKLRVAQALRSYAGLS